MGGSRGRLISCSERKEAIELIQEAHLAGARKREACKVLNLSLRTIERWEKADGLVDRRKFAKKCPGNKLREEERSMILSICNESKYRDLPPCKIVPLLADEGRYIASESSFYRVLKAEKQLTHRGHSKARRHQKPKVHSARQPNQVWSWDITYLPSLVKGLYFYLYLVMDIYSRKIVGFSVHEKESADYASLLIHQTCCDEKISRNQIVLHSDNGSPMKGLTMLAMLETLGVLPSFSRPSVSDDNPYSESLFRTLKYHPTFPAVKKFSNISDARIWCEAFCHWYNHEHLHSGLKFITPHQRHSGADKEVMLKRHIVYQKAKAKYPMRWSRETRNWELPTVVTLNAHRKKNAAANAGTPGWRGRWQPTSRERGALDGRF